MAKLYNLAAMTVASTGTGVITLGSAATIGGVLYLSFAIAGVGNGETIAYSIEDVLGSEAGTAVYSSTGPTITRTVVNSTFSNNPINVTLSAIVRISPLKADIANLRELNTFTAAQAISDATASTDTTHGALTVVGGVGIGGALNVGGTLSVTGASTLTNVLTVTGPATALDSYIATFQAAASAARASLTVINTAAAATSNVATNSLRLNSSTQIRTAFQFDASFSATTDASRTSLVLMSGASAGTFGTVMQLSGFNVSIPNGSLTANNQIFSNLSGFNPAANDTSAFIAQGAFGGGYTLQDGTGRIGVWSQSSGGLLNIGVGGTSSGITAQLTMTTATLALSQSTPSTLPTNGALTVVGGVGIGGAANVGGTINIGGTNTNAAPSAYNILVGTGGSSSTTVPVGGNYWNVNYDNNYGAYTSFYWMNNTGTTAIALGVRGGGVNTDLLLATNDGTSRVDILPNTPSTNATSGALRVTGGVGIQGALNVGGTLAVTGASTLTGSVGIGAAPFLGQLTITGVQPGQSYQDTAGGSGKKVFKWAYDGAVALSQPGLVWQNYSDAAAFVSNSGVLWRDGAASFGSTTYPGSAGSVAVGGTLSVTGASTLSGAAVFYSSLAVSGLITSGYNINGGSPSGGGTGYAFSTNFSSSQGEVNFWNLYYPASFSFDWRQLTAAGVSTQLMKLTTSGLVIPLSTTSTSATSGALVIGNGSSGGLGVGGDTFTNGKIVSINPTSGVGYATGAGGAVTQITSRTTGVTLSKVSGAITLFAAAPAVGTWVSCTVTNTTVAATDTVSVSVKSGTNTYIAHVTAVAAGSFQISFTSIVGTASDSPVINFNVIKGVNA